MFAIPAPLPQFFDMKGTPLSNGKLYFGAEGADPEVSPVPVFWDSSGLVVATQPVRTLNGYPARSGTPAALYTAGECSIRVRDSTDRQILYTQTTLTASAVGAMQLQLATLASASSAAYGAGQIGYGGGLNYAVGTVGAALNEVVSVAAFGFGPSNSATDNVTAMNAAIAWASILKRPLFVPGFTSNCLVNDEFTIPTGVKVSGSGYWSSIEQTAQGKNIFIVGDDCSVEDMRLQMPAGNQLDLSKQSAVYISGKKRVRVMNNWIQNADSCCGIQVRASTDIILRGNIIWGGSWDGATAGIPAVVSDILFYSGSAGARCVVEGNFCLSNNSQGIFFNALGLDTDSTISNNVCVTLNSATWSLQATGGVRRHGIVVAYLGTNPSRTAISGNVCRNTRWTGIYVQSDGTGSGQNASVVDNVCSLNGQDTTQALAGGIFISSNGGETVTGNTVTDYAGTVTGSYVVNGVAVGGSTGTTLSSNTSFNSAGNGFFLGNRTRDIIVSDNLIQNSAGSDVSVSATAGDAGLGGHQIVNNSCLRNNTNAPAIRIDQQAGLRRTKVAHNKLRGLNNTTATASNAGVSIIGQASAVDVIDNHIDTFRYGVDYPSLLTAATRYYAEFTCDRNRLSNCNQGIGLSSGTAATSTMPLEANLFDGCTTNVGTGSAAGFAVGYIAQRLDSAIVFRSTASPTTGSWAVGDRALRTSPVVGQPKAWSCTVAGAPGTWVSEGNL